MHVRDCDAHVVTACRLHVARGGGRAQRVVKEPSRGSLAVTLVWAVLERRPALLAKAIDDESRGVRYPSSYSEAAVVVAIRVVKFGGQNMCP